MKNRKSNFGAKLVRSVSILAAVAFVTISIHPADAQTLYRGMKQDPNIHDHLLPENGATARTLGVRPNTDIPVDSKGMVNPNTGGMSVAPNTPYNLPRHRRPPAWGGTGKDPVWSIGANNLPRGLRYRADSSTHGLIEPASRMRFTDFQFLLWLTQGSWSFVVPPVPLSEPNGTPYCGDFEGVDWPPYGRSSARPRGFSSHRYQPRAGFPGALFAGPYQWGGERCGGACTNFSGEGPICRFSWRW